MATPVYVDTTSFFYPIGNTPAVSLIRDLPREQAANALLLGCGDLRNILFTIYSDQGTAHRPLDFTCCDIQPATIARNVILLSLILDGEEHDAAALWSIYYHIFVTDKALQLVSVQARKLHNHSASLDTWHNSQYGRTLRFCDHGTLDKVRSIWETYCVSELNKSQREAYNKAFLSKLQKAKDIQREKTGNHGSILTGVRSAAPAGFQAVEKLPLLYRYYWEHGAVGPEGELPVSVRSPNPMFNTPDTAIIHYGSDPLLGFHLALAFIALSKSSPLRTNPATAVDAAQTEFREWTNSVRRRSGGSLVVRFFAGDAIAFSYALQSKAVGKGETPVGLYRDSWSLEPLVLGVDYEEAGTAPLSFSVIDTSNLIDHLGALNILTATAPLLDNQPYASLYTESLVKREDSHSTYVENLLCGHFTTTSTLLRIFPAEYWTNVSPVSAVDDILLQASLGGEGGQMHIRFSWKRPFGSHQPMQHPTPLLRLDEAGCANILLKIYLSMFKNESMSHLFSGLSMHQLSLGSLLHYHRKSFALLLRQVRGRVDLNWSAMMEKLLGLIYSDRTLMVGSNYLQELHLHLHLLGLYSSDVLLELPPVAKSLPAKGLYRWKNMLSVVRITLKVPRARFSFLPKLKPSEVGNPIVICGLRSPQNATEGWHNLFSTLQLTFGSVSTSGPRHSNDFQIQVKEDPERWFGKSPLVVSFLAPAWSLRLEQRTRVSFGVQTTPQSAYALQKYLGMEMLFFETTLEDEANVFITADYSPTSSTLPYPQPEHDLTPDTARCVFTGNINNSRGSIESLVGRLEIPPGEIRARLQTKCEIEPAKTSPFSYVVKFDDGKFQLPLDFPGPILPTNTKIRIARKSAYVEIEASLANRIEWGTFPEFVYPSLLADGVPLLWNAPRLNLDTTPMLNVDAKDGMRWLNIHVSSMFTPRQRKLRDRSSTGGDIRLALRDSLFTLFTVFSRQEGQKARLFGLNCQSAGGCNVLLLVSSMRLDLSNRTVVLDTAVLPLTMEIMPTMVDFLRTKLDAICQITVDQDELRLWKQILPSMVERCRTWEHLPSCEYRTQSRLPLSVEVAQTPLCSCGNGKLPSNFITGVSEWASVSKLFVRAAISPCFSAPFAEEIFNLNAYGNGSQPTEAASGSTGSKTGCGVCGKTQRADGSNLLTCSRCKEAKYCSAECQRADWKSHKRSCKQT